jgi:hypothetical protein
MMNWFARFLKDWIAPFYYLWFFIGIIVAVFNFISIKSRPLVLWIAENAYEWWTGVDLAPSLARTPDPIKLTFWVVLNSLLIILLLAIAQIFRTRRRWRFVVGEMRNCIELHLAFRQNVARMKASPSSFERARISLYRAQSATADSHLPKKDEQYSLEEPQKRFTDALRGARLAGHKPMESLTPKKGNLQRKPKKKSEVSA